MSQSSSKCEASLWAWHTVRGNDATYSRGMGLILVCTVKKFHSLIGNSVLTSHLGTGTEKIVPYDRGWADLAGRMEETRSSRAVICNPSQRPAKTNRSARDWKGLSRVTREIGDGNGDPRASCVRGSRGGCGRGSECVVESGAVKEEGTGQGVPEEYGRCQGCGITRYEMIVKKGTKGQSEPRQKAELQETFGVTEWVAAGIQVAMNQAW
ncbi:hypothetical protein H4582DRAFT_2054420 [Lactarius indigo]|nr:hypothetical protein H4582DRAFT_2054420 [Lactarius indigo]